MTKKAGLVMAVCLVLAMGGWTAYAAPPPPAKPKSSSMAPSGHHKQHYGSPIQKPILKHVAPKPKVKSTPQLKSTPLPAQTPPAAPKAP